MHMQHTIDAPTIAPDRRDRSAADTLFSSLYEELHRLARHEVARQQHGSAGLGVTTLLHEAYLAMADREGMVFPDRARFMAYAARVMRGLVIDEARARHTQKRGGGIHLTTLPVDLPDRLSDAEALIRIGDALDALAAYNPALAEIVDLKFFCGFSVPEVAAMRGLSERTVRRNWQKSRLYLHRAVGGAWPLD